MPFYCVVELQTLTWVVTANVCRFTSSCIYIRVNLSQRSGLPSSVKPVALWVSWNTLGAHAKKIRDLQKRFSYLLHTQHSSLHSFHKPWKDCCLLETIIGRGGEGRHLGWDLCLGKISMYIHGWGPSSDIGEVGTASSRQTWNLGRLTFVDHCYQ